MSQITLTYQEITDAASRLRLGQDEMHAKITELGTLVDTLVANGFRTEQASTAFAETFGTYKESLKVAVDALEQMAGFLDVTLQTFQSDDESLAAQIRS